MKEVIVATGAHPDDIELGCGGTLKKYIDQGSYVFGVILTKGEMGNHCPSGNEYHASSEFLGFTDIFVFDFPDGYITRDCRTISTIEEIIRKVRATTVFTHSPRDRHQDHHYTSLCSSAAARKVRNIFFYESPSTTSEFFPHVFSDINDTLGHKLEALSFYRSQIEKNIVNLDRVKGQAIYWGQKNDMEFVEAFEINHMIL